MRHLILNLESPLMAFGGETIDKLGVIRWFPAASMLTGLFANALGWRRTERERHQRLQDRLIFAARIDREPAGGVRMTDFQTAQLGANDRGWTTRGQPEGRTGGANTYDSPHLRFRDYFADMRLTVALRLQPEAEAPTLDDLLTPCKNPRALCSSDASRACPPQACSEISAPVIPRWPLCWRRPLMSLAAVKMTSSYCGPTGKARTASPRIVPTCSPTSAIGAPVCTGAGDGCAKARRSGANLASPSRRQRKGMKNND